MIALNDDKKKKHERAYTRLHVLSVLFILGALLTLTGCQQRSSSSDDTMSALGGEEAAGESSEPTGGERPPICPFTEDGVCDEPTQCALGSD